MQERTGTTTLQVRSVNTGEPRNFVLGGYEVSSAIFKTPVAGRIAVTELGLAGDRQADLAVHGGPLKAVYFYPWEHYAGWETLLGKTGLEPGSFGENITSEGLVEADVAVGDVLRVGTAYLQIVQPRSPCYKLQLRFERPDIVAMFVRYGRAGWYASVVREGEVEAGDAIEVIERAPDRVSVADVWRYSLEAEAPPEMRQRVAKLDLLPAFWKDRITG